MRATYHSVSTATPKTRSIPSFVTESGMTGELTASWAGRGGGTMPGTGDVFYTSAGRVSGDVVTLEDGSTANLAELYEAECPDERKQRDFPLGLTDPFALAQYEWLQAIRERRPPETSGRDAMTSLACAFTVLEAAQAGTPRRRGRGRFRPAGRLSAGHQRTLRDRLSRENRRHNQRGINERGAAALRDDVPPIRRLWTVAAPLRPGSSPPIRPPAGLGSAISR